MKQTRQITLYFARVIRELRWFPRSSVGIYTNPSDANLVTACHQNAKILKKTSPKFLGGRIELETEIKNQLAGLKYE